MLNFKIEGNYIELVKLLKALKIAVTGGHAKIMIENGDVFRNGEPEYRKRAKIRPGDQLEIQGNVITIE